SVRCTCLASWLRSLLWAKRRKAIEVSAPASPRCRRSVRRPCRHLQDRPARVRRYLSAGQASARGGKRCANRAARQSWVLCLPVTRRLRRAGNKKAALLGGCFTLEIQGLTWSGRQDSNLRLLRPER